MRCLDCGTRTRGSRCVSCQGRREWMRNYGAAQRALLNISPRQRERVYRRDGYRCVDSGTSHDLTLDHVVPLALKVEPTYGDDALATRCRSCNSRKGARRV